MKLCTLWFALLMILATYALAAGAAEPLKSKQREPQKYVLAIGVSKFQDSRWNPLKYAHEDAKAIHDHFVSRGFGGRLLASDPEIQPMLTKSAIVRAMKQLAAENKSEDDVVVVYFSGHGTLARTTDSSSGREVTRKFMVLADTAWDDVAGNGLSQEEVLEMFQRLPSRRKALIIDTCYSGGGKAQLTGKILSFLAQQKAGQIQEPPDSVSEGFSVYAASAWGEEAQESDALRHGVYTYFLLNAFDTQADLDGDGATRLSEAHLFATNKVIEFTHSGQHPSAQINNVGRDPVVVAGTPVVEGTPILTAWNWGHRKLKAVINGQSQGTLLKGFVTVPPEKVRLTLLEPVSGKTLVDRYVSFEPGGEYSVTDFLYDEEPNSLSLGGTSLSFLRAEDRRTMAPGALWGLQLSYSRENAWGDFDVRAAYAYFGWAAKTVPVRMRFGAQEKTEERVSRLRMQKANVSLEHRSRLARLSTFNRAVNTSVAWNAGPSLLILDRMFPDMSSETLRGVPASVSLWGAFLQAGLQTQLTQWNLQAGADVSAGLFENRLGTSGSLVFTGDVGLNVGMFW